MGSSIVKNYLTEGHEVIVVDNLISGSLKNIDEFRNNDRLTIHQIDCTESQKISDVILECNLVLHFAANPDIRKSQAEHDIDFHNNILATYNLLKCLSKSNKLEKFIFASSSVVYGEPSIMPTPENYGPLIPISNYGASKLACEALISSFSNNYNFKSILLRFANVVGPKSNHGVIYDFLQKLKKNPNELEILGDGSQKKSYIHVADFISGMQKAIEYDGNTIEVFNVGTEQQTGVTNIAKILVEEMNLEDVKFHFNNSLNNGRGWIGDVKVMLLDNTKLKSTGWNPKYSSDDAVRLTIHDILTSL